MHYTTNGEATKDRTSIGLLFAKQPPIKTLVTGNAMNARFAIPPGDGNHEVKSTTTFKEDVHLTSFMPHMHFRGKDFIYTAVYPDGRSEVLLNVPKYDFNWQLTYIPDKPIALPKGTAGLCGPFRQFNQEQVQSGSEQGSALGRPDLGRNDDRLVHVHT